MSKGLEALRKLDEMGYLNIPMPKPNVEWTDEDDKALGYAYDLQKELKALESIKVILKDLIEFNEIDLPHINKVIYEIKICDKAIYASKEKYDLLKEVLL